MSELWHTYCTGECFRLADETVAVELGDGRLQRVKVDDRGDAFLLRSVVARPAVVLGLEDAALEVWMRNRMVPLVGFRIDERGRLVGEAWVPKVGLSREEFIQVLKHLAQECDRYEFQLTGEDRE